MQCRNLYARALSIDPEDYESNFNLAVLLYEHKRDIDKAIHHFKVAINEQANPIALFNLAVIYDEL
jgi:tetratricopeptide (TPR) repeat protein